MMNLNRLLPVRPISTQLNSTQQRQGLLFNELEPKTEEKFVLSYVGLVNRFIRRRNPWGGYALSPASSPSTANVNATGVRGIKMFYRPKENEFNFRINTELETVTREFLAHAIRLFDSFGGINSSKTFYSRISSVDVPPSKDTLSAFVSGLFSSNGKTRITDIRSNIPGSPKTLINTTQLKRLGGASNLWEEQQEGLLVPAGQEALASRINSLKELRLPSEDAQRESTNVILTFPPLDPNKPIGNAVERFQAGRRVLEEFWERIAQPTLETRQQIGLEGS
ncbi:MAG: hypothetical protein ACK551_05835 [Vampirovibrionales bacterium]